MTTHPVSIFPAATSQGKPALVASINAHTRLRTFARAIRTSRAVSAPSTIAHRELDQHHAPVPHRTGSQPGEDRPEFGGQASLISTLTQYDGPGMANESLGVPGDRQPVVPSLTIHLLGVPDSCDDVI